MKQKAVTKECTGDAHKPEVAGNMDHCMVCMPRWGKIVSCPIDGAGLASSGFCHKCRKFYDVS